MNKLNAQEKVRVVACLVEGNSLRSTVRMTGIVTGHFKTSQPGSNENRPL